MALNTPGFDLIPSAERVAISTNYITDFNFLNQYLPDTYEKEFERYGNRTLSSFLRMVGAEMPSNSDMRNYYYRRKWGCGFKNRSDYYDL